jgi:hypothetical protein
MDAENVTLEVSQHELIGNDPTNSDHHLFEIKVWLIQTFYSVKRTYSNICEFDLKLRKRYPKSHLPECPLSTTGANRRNSLTRVTSTFTVPSQENMSQKKPLLGKYFEDLLDIPEILRSVEMLTFLDIESINGLELASHDSLSLIETLLSKSKEVTLTVGKEYNLRLEVSETQFLVWRFQTKKKDIGFDVQMETSAGSGGATGGTTGGGTASTTSLVPYQRYHSHEEAVADVLEIQSSGFVILHWDNSYSKMRSKQLSYVFRVVDAEVYQEATKVCLDSSRNKLECESKRNALRRIFSARASSILASSGIRSSLSAAAIMEYKSSTRSASTSHLSSLSLSWPVSVSVCLCLSPSLS